jgi:hypothetical protein
MASMRKIENIIISHYNLNTWGWTEKKILNAYKNDLAFYKYAAKKQQLFVVNIDEPALFNNKKFLEYLGVDSLNPEAEHFIQKWYIVNPLDYQKEKAGEELGGKKIPAILHSLRKRHPWIIDLERDMHKLWKKCI